MRPTVDAEPVNMCKYCKLPIYIKVVQYTEPILAPLTRVEQLEQELTNLTGEVYMQLPNNYCPMCGARIDGRVNRNDK